MTADSAITDTIATETKKELGLLEKYLEDALPKALDFAIDVILAAVVFFIGTRVIKWLVKIVKKSIERANVEPGVVTFICSLCKYVLYFILILIILSQFGVTASSVVAVLGSAGLTVGLALQGSLSNFAGGILILLLKPFVVGDYIIENADKQEGTVSEITIFYTKLLTVDNKAIMIPNGTLSNTSIVNVTAMNKRRLDLRFGVAYESDIQKVKEILNRVAIGDEAVLKAEDSNVFVSELKDSCIEMGVRCWVKTEDYWTAKWRITENIKNEFDKAGISIPFPQVEVTMKSNEK
jgi:small conductance mechanosensitive channel